MLASILAVSGCSAGAGMQATPPAPIAQSGDSTTIVSPLRTAGDAAAQDLTETALQPPVSQSVAEGSVPTGAGGRFLLI